MSINKPVYINPAQSSGGGTTLPTYETGKFLTNDGTDLSWATTTVTAHNLLSTTHGDSTAASCARGSVIIGDASSKWVALAFPGTPTGKVLIATATDVAWSGSALGTAAYTASTAYEAAGATASHAALTTGVHGLAITAGQTLTVTSGGTIGTAAYTASGDYATSGHNHSGTYEPLFTVGTWAGTTNITTLGTIATGVWGGTAVAADHGGTGQTSYAIGDILHATSSSAVGKLADVAVGQVLASGGVGAVPAYTASPTLTGTVTANNFTASETLGTELVDQFADWNVVGNWTYGTGKWSHTSGSAVALTATITAALDFTPSAGTCYKVVVTNTTGTASTGFAVSMGGVSYMPITATGTNTYYITASDGTVFTITPASGWIGSIDSVSVKVVTNADITVGNTIVDPSGIRLPVGSAKYPSLFFADDIDTGIYYSPTALYFSIGGTQRAYINASGIVVAGEVCGGTGDLGGVAFSSYAINQHNGGSELKIASTNTNNTNINQVLIGSGTYSQAASSSNAIVKIGPTYNQTSTANATDLLINRTETAVGSGTQRILSAQVAGVEKAAIDNKGAITSTLINNADSDTDEVDSVVFAGGYGIVIACSTTDGTSAVWKLKGTVFEAIEVDADWTVTKDGAATYNVYIEAGSIKLQNKVGDNKVVKLGYFGI